MLGPILALAVTAMAEVEVHLAPDPTAAGCLKNGWVTARSSDGQALVKLPLREDDRAYRVQLAAGPVWEIAIDADGCWSETALVPGGGGALTLALHRAAIVSGAFESDLKTGPDGELRGLIFPQQRGGAGESLGVNGLATRCELDYPQWQCGVPADVPLDLRLELPGFGAVHYFGIAAAVGPAKKLPPQPLLAGATLSGWVEDSARLAVPNAKLTLYPMQVQAHFGETAGLAARGQVATANAKGFFQFGGLQPGLYRLVSEAEGFSPVNVPEVRVREGEFLVWPRPILQPPVAHLEVLLSPPLDPEGSPWTVELREKAPLHVARVPPLQKKATAEGRWDASGLRADAYWLEVHDRRGATLERTSVDLGEGGLETIALDVRSIAVNGVLLMGDEPLGGYLHFTNYSGKDVEARAGNDGVFRAVFPAGGKWMPRLEYPRQGDSRIQLDAVNIDPEKVASKPLELRVPGGRIRGQALGPQKTPEPGVVVHLIRDETRLVADAQTGPDGRFDLVAIAPGSYMIQADGNRIATPRATPLALRDDETKELTLLLTPKRRIEVVILTPFGTPASGAWVKVARYSDQGWFLMSADASGRFGFSVPGEAGDVPLVVVTYAWPSTSLRIPADRREPVTIRLQAEGGALRVRNAPFPVIRTPGLQAPLSVFQIPPPQGRRDDPALMEPGTYVVCPDRDVPDDACRTVTIVPGMAPIIDFEGES
ncbi:MAG: carboxypeptidase-like regulatory domain-containing protein [Thermoanaerobaculia bacterium]